MTQPRSPFPCEIDVFPVGNRGRRLCRGADNGRLVPRDRESRVVGWILVLRWQTLLMANANTPSTLQQINGVHGRQRGESHIPRAQSATRERGDLRRLHLKGLELAGATLRIFCRDRIPLIPRKRILGTIRRPEALVPAAVRSVDRAWAGQRSCRRRSGERQVPSRDRACPWLIERVYPEPDRLARLN